MSISAQIISNYEKEIKELIDINKKLKRNALTETDKQNIKRFDDLKYASEQVVVAYNCKDMKMLRRRLEKLKILIYPHVKKGGRVSNDNKQCE